MVATRVASGRALVVVLGAALLVVLGRWAVGSLRPPLVLARPDLARLESLSHYLAPAAGGVKSAPPVAIPPGADPFDAPPPAVVPRAGPVRSAAGAGPAPRVSAILVAGERRVAILGDRIYGVGDVVPGHGRVAAIDPDRVVLVAPDGRRRVLRLLPEAVP